MSDSVREELDTTHPPVTSSRGKVQEHPIVGTHRDLNGVTRRHAQEAVLRRVLIYLRPRASDAEAPRPTACFGRDDAIHAAADESNVGSREAIDDLGLAPAVVFAARACCADRTPSRRAQRIRGVAQPEAEQRW